MFTYVSVCKMIFFIIRQQSLHVKIKSFCEILFDDQKTVRNKKKTAIEN